MGSLLLSQTLGGIWWVDLRSLKHINDLNLSPDGLQDANLNNSIAPTTIDTSYEPFLMAILKREDIGHIIFPYDWRKMLTESADQLRDLVVKTYNSNGKKPVHLVGHSMGGLMLRTALMKHGKELWPLIGRIVFIGTPHYGSPSIAGYLKNHLWGFDMMALLGVYLSRETFRTLWGVLSLLPAPAGIYPGTRPGSPSAWKSPDANAAYQHPCANFNLYDAASWKLDLTPEQEKSLQTILNGTAEFYKKLYDDHISLSQEQRDKMLVIAGVGYKTLFRLEFQSHLWGAWETTNKITSRNSNDPHREGDSRVPLASAALENVTIRYVKGSHGGLPNIPEVYNDVFNWLKGEELTLPTTVNGALNQHLDANTSTSTAPHLDGSFRESPFSDDAGVWNETPPSTEVLNALDVKLNQGQLGEFMQVRLL
jgi:pimeloyl-ACP methyl ester carboxylesterase